MVIILNLNHDHGFYIYTCIYICIPIMVKVIVSCAALTSVNRECSQGSVITSEEAVHPQFGTRTTLFGEKKVWNTSAHFVNTV